MSETVSEKLFEQYLDSNGYDGKWTYEPQIPGKSRKPDYLLDYNGLKYFFEVKELREKPNQSSGWFDPYASLRGEINEARQKFKEYKQCSCSLVVFNVSDLHAILKPICVFGAMLGNLGVTWDIKRAEKKRFDETVTNAFLDSGKMIDYKGKRPQNTTISAIVVLEEYIDNLEVTNVPRVVVIENPFARVAFPEDLFNGPFDECWKWENNKIKRVFVGSKLRQLEELKSKS